MYSKVFSRSAVSVLGWVFFFSLCIGLSGNIALAEDPLDLCGNNDEFTTDFRLEDCKFKDKGENPYFILKPGYRVVLESEDEKSVETVLRDKKTITLPRDGKKDRKIKTRVVEERAYEDGVLVEISLNYFAICKKTNAVYYFGEFSRDCEEGFGENDECEDESNDGSWEAGVNGARPGLIMPGTFLLGAKYFQEIAEIDEAVDRGENVEMGLPPVETEAGTFEDCVKVIDTNPAEGACNLEDEPTADIKIYCPGIGIVQDEELVLTSYGFVDD